MLLDIALSQMLKEVPTATIGEQQNKESITSLLLECQSGGNIAVSSEIGKFTSKYFYFISFQLQQVFKGRQLTQRNYFLFIFIAHWEASRWAAT